MSCVSVRVLKDELSEYLRRAEGGERLTVTRDGIAIAQIVPMETVHPADDLAAFAALVQAGTLSRVPIPFGDLPALVDLGGASASQRVLEDRR